MQVSQEAKKKYLQSYEKLDWRDIQEIISKNNFGDDPLNEMVNSTNKCLKFFQTGVATLHTICCINPKKLAYKYNFTLERNFK